MRHHYMPYHGAAYHILTQVCMTWTTQLYRCRCVHARCGFPPPPHHTAAYPHTCDLGNEVFGGQILSTGVDELAVNVLTTLLILLWVLVLMLWLYASSTSVITSVIPDRSTPATSCTRTPASWRIHTIITLIRSITFYESYNTNGTNSDSNNDNDNDMNNHETS